MDVSALLDELLAPEAAIRRLPMSWDEFLALPEEFDAEWVDGEAVLSPRPGWAHGEIVVTFGAILKTVLAGLFVGTEVGVWLPGNRLRSPDLMVVAGRPSTTFVETPPVLVVEVLSASTRSEDLLRKGPEYAAAGIGQFWVVDPQARSIEVNENVDGTWRLLLRLDDEHPTGEVRVGEHGSVPLDLVAILGPVDD